MATKQKMLQLANSLAERTRAGDLTWGETAEENTFRAVLSHGIVRIGRHENPYAHAGEGAVPVTTGLPFSLPPGFQPSGEFIYSLWVLDTQSQELGRLITANQEEASALQPLWALAASDAGTPEKKFDSILGELSRKANK